MSISASMELENAIKGTTKDADDDSDESREESVQDDDDKMTEDKVWEDLIIPFYSKCIFPSNFHSGVRL